MLKEKKRSRKGETLYNKHYLKNTDFSFFLRESFNRLDFKSMSFNLKTTIKIKNMVIFTFFSPLLCSHIHLCCTVRISWFAVSTLIH